MQRLYKLLQQPYSDASDLDIGLGDPTQMGVYEGQRPEWACTLRVGCSS